jgi:tetratricopeptide (TPR) repeat protein
VSAADDPLGAALVSEGRRRYEAGDYTDAEPLAQRAVELRPPGSDPALRAEALQLQGEVVYGLGRYRDARAIAEAAAALRAGAAPVDRAETTNLLGIIDLSLGDAASGLARVEEAYRDREAALGPDHPDTIESLNNTGVALGRVDRMDEAIAMHEEALRRLARSLPGPHRQHAVTRNALAVKLARDAATRDRANRLYEEALVAAEAALGPEDPLVATLLANLATQHLNVDDLDGARAYAARSLPLHERRHGLDHPSTATALVTAAVIADRDGNTTEARDLLDRVVAIRLEAYGPADVRTHQALRMLLRFSLKLVPEDPRIRPDVVALGQSLNMLAPDMGPNLAPELRTSDPAEAERVLRRYLARAAARRTPVDAAMRLELERTRAALLAADAAFMAGDHDVAVIALGEAIDRIRAARGEDDLLQIEPLIRLAVVERVRGDRLAAIRRMGEAVDVIAHSYGERHPFVVASRQRLASAAPFADARSKIPENPGAVRRRLD